MKTAYEILQQHHELLPRDQHGQLPSEYQENQILAAMDEYAAEAAKTTERRLFAAMAMQGMISDDYTVSDFPTLASFCVQISDALIAELDKPQAETLSPFGPEADKQIREDLDNLTNF
jgi:hypothetical protein